MLTLTIFLTLYLTPTLTLNIALPNRVRHGSVNIHSHFLICIYYMIFLQVHVYTTVQILQCMMMWGSKERISLPLHCLPGPPLSSSLSPPIIPHLCPPPSSLSLVLWVHLMICHMGVQLLKAKIWTVSSDTYQLQFIKLHHFKLERFKSI